MKKKTTLDKKIQRLATVVWQKHLKLEGIRTLTLDSKKFHPGLSICIILTSGFSIGDRKFKRDIRRTFTVGRITKVPSFAADDFLETAGVVEVFELKS